MDLFDKKCGFPGEERAEEIRRTRALEGIRGTHVLLAEDNKLNQVIALDLLKQAGITVTLADNGREAIERLTEATFDAVLMDMQMPEMDGFAATKAIRQQPKFSELPIIAMTAQTMAGDRERCLAAGMNGYVAKPIEPDVLYDVLFRLLKPETYRKLPVNEKKGLKLGEKDFFVDDFPSIEGVDVQAGLKNLNEDRNLYLKVLGDFFSRYHDIVADIQAALARKELGTAKRLAHNFKGLAGTIGAKGLQNRFIKLDSYLKKNEIERIPEIMNSFSAEVERVMIVLEALFQEYDYRESDIDGDAEIHRELDKEGLRKGLSKLGELIDAGDSESVALIRKIKDSIGPKGVTDTFRQLETQISDYDFEDALDTLKRLYIELELD